MSNRVTFLSVIAAVAGSSVLGVASEEVVHTKWETFAPQFRTHACPFPADAIEDDRARITCGYVLVPEDRTNPASQLIKLSVVKASARQETRADLTLALLLPGGPGAPTIDFLLRALATDGKLPPFTAQFDLIAFDQRGIGYSAPNFCREVPRPWLRGVAMIPDGEARFREDMRRCLREARSQGVAVDAYSTWHNAHDVRDVRRALGYARWNLWGASYGGRLAQAVMQIDAPGVRAAILDSAIPAVLPDDSPSAGLAAGLRSSLTVIGRACTADVRCARDVGDLAGRLEAAIESYDHQPLVLDRLDADVFERGRIVLDGQLVASTIFVTLYAPQLYAGLPLFVKALEDRDSEAMVAHLTPLLGAFRADHAFGVGMNLVSNCRSDFITTSAAVRAAERLSRWVIEPQLGDNAVARCTEAYRVDPDASVAPLVSDIPSLVLSGLSDPATPPSFARAILPGLANATLLEFPYTGHGVLPTLNDYAAGCGDSILVAFIRDPRARIDTSCAGAIHAPEFQTRIRETKRPMRFLASVRAGSRPIAPVATLLGLVVAVVAYPLAAIARRIDGRRQTRLRRARVLAWLAAALSVLGTCVAAWALFVTVSRYLLALPIGVAPWIAWGGWLSLCGVLCAVAAVSQYLQNRKNAAAGIGVLMGIGGTTVLSIACFVFLTSIGAGPLSW